MKIQPHITKRPDTHHYYVRVPRQGVTRAERVAKKVARIALQARDLHDGAVPLSLYRTDTDYLEFITRDQYPPRYPLGYKPILPPQPVVGSHVMITDNRLSGHSLMIDSVGEVIDISERDSGSRQIVVRGVDVYGQSNATYRVSNSEYSLTEAPVSLSLEDQTRVQGFTEGAHVRILNDSNSHRLQVGQVVEINRVQNNYGTITFRVRGWCDYGSYNECRTALVLLQDVELTDEPVSGPPDNPDRPEGLEPGSHVRIIAGHQEGSAGYHWFRLGQVVEVTHVGHNLLNAEGIRHYDEAPASWGDQILQFDHVELTDDPLTDTSPLSHLTISD